MAGGEYKLPTYDHLLDLCTQALVEDTRSSDVGDVEICRRAVMVVLDELVESLALFTADRWDEDCHRCEQRIGDHTIDGRCPGQPINVIFDGPPAAESGRFVEVETDDGTGVEAGEWLNLGEQLNGMWALRITRLPERTE